MTEKKTAVILNEMKNPTLSRNYLLLLKAEGSFGAEAPQDDTAWHVILSEAPPVRRAGKNPMHNN